MNHRTLIGVFCFVLIEFTLRASGQPPTQPQPPPAADAARGAVQVLDELPTSALNIDRWAVIVGISKYKDERWNLKYADRDADELSELLQKGTGGGFAKDHILKLTNEQATTGAIQKALRSFLKKPGKDDVVLLYFSCHGSADPDRPEILYLLTHDTDRDDISGTALPMREINASLQEYLQARRVVILADACHSCGHRRLGPPRGGRVRRGRGQHVPPERQPGAHGDGALDVGGGQRGGAGGRTVGGRPRGIHLLPCWRACAGRPSGGSPTGW